MYVEVEYFSLSSTSIGRGDALIDNCCHDVFVCYFCSVCFIYGLICVSATWTMQVVDWEEGGRTTAAHVQRIFDKEQATGPNSVQAIIHRCSFPSPHIHTVGTVHKFELIA